MTPQTPLQTAPSSSFSERDFRDAMGSFATGVCVVTANNADGKAIGMTVNSFSSVSLNPPLVLFCLGDYSARSQAILAADTFNISMLGADQMDDSNHFARPGEGLALDGMTVSGQNGCPVVPGAAAVIECTMDTQHGGGDHVIVVGRVTHLETDQSKAPLLYFRGGYRKLDGEA